MSSKGTTGVDVSSFSFVGGGAGSSSVVLNPSHVPVISAVGTWSFSQASVEHFVESCLKDILMAIPTAATPKTLNGSVSSSSSTAATDATPSNFLLTSGSSTSAVIATTSAVTQSAFTIGESEGEDPSIRETLARSANVGEHLVKSIELVEEDKAVHTVGLYSYPNADGVLQLDGAYMNPTRDEIGSALGIIGFDGAIRAAYMVARESPHTVLAGTGAERFLVEKGMPQKDPKDQPIWTEDCGKGKEQASRHDTVGMVALCGKEIVVGTSTSGMKGKHAGRIGDSAVFGSGLYAAAGVGGAAATGDGDVIVKFPFAFVAVEALRSGMTPQHAAQHAIARLSATPGFDLLTSEAAIVVMNMQGEYGYATTHAWEGVFTPAYADVDTLRAREEARAHSRRMRAQSRGKGGQDPASPHSPSGGGCVVQ